MCRQWGRKQNSTFVMEMKEAVINNGPGCPCNHMQAVDDSRYLKLGENDSCLYTFEEGLYLDIYGTLVSFFLIRNSVFNETVFNYNIHDKHVNIQNTCKYRDVNHVMF